MIRCLCVPTAGAVEPRRTDKNATSEPRRASVTACGNRPSHRALFIGLLGHIPFLAEVAPRAEPEERRREQRECRHRDHEEVVERMDDCRGPDGPHQLPERQPCVAILAFEGDLGNSRCADACEPRVDVKQHSDGDGDEGQHVHRRALQQLARIFLGGLANLWRRACCGHHVAGILESHETKADAEAHQHESPWAFHDAPKTAAEAP
mmetsp:Transcript_9236/g.20523  ORF Transcript_9236/g.20523 Transcript_9236/m.20523 type:complete len:207 (+) Transcript_9236:51-671(+)